MTIRADIISNMKTALETISVSNGYNLDVQLVSERMLLPDEVKEDKFPCLFLIDTNETKEDTEVTELKNNLTVLVSGYVKDHENPDPELKQLLEDVERALCLDRYRNNLSINTLPRDIKTDAGTLKPFGVFDFEFIIPYFQPYGSP